MVARALQLGAAWDLAWAEASARYAPLAEALAPHGSRELVRTRCWWRARITCARDATSRREKRAERLAVRLVVPLGLCQLPAFVLLGLVPVLLGLL
ncbi:hypothetical protein H8R18_08625 [Nanchangia anserum]|uniref:hypothetical protein n=1 Tax=Nanchangia anserum TaxID=2692125 RepID=UPI001883D4A0|nr:hypothetical protein [Nanchangia anserum]QOX81761.1 hypothetical protein H8R18_08625 [Nanchangia anserum]